MTVLLIGVGLFFGIHSIRIFGDGWRTRTIERIGDGPYKGIYSLAAILGLVLIAWGFRLARQEPVFVWWPPVWTRHLASLLVLVAFVMVTAAYVPKNHIKAKLKHPMVLGVKTWAFAHLIANGKLADMILFGVALLWAILNFRSARRRESQPKLEGRTGPTVVTVVAGVAGWAAFAFWLHQWIIGIRPF